MVMNREGEQFCWMNISKIYLKWRLVRLSIILQQIPTFSTNCIAPFHKIFIRNWYSRNCMHTECQIFGMNNTNETMVQCIGLSDMTQGMGWHPLKFYSHWEWHIGIACNCNTLNKAIIRGLEAHFITIKDKIEEDVFFYTSCLMAPQSMQEIIALSIAKHFRNYIVQSRISKVAFFPKGLF